ncbi:Aste57867_16885 [Aphanomyces stellatus]|uniref:Aste57867_16885 protein n=1 Tax=Aphanomyces stellatus TaxID=120398 RepID=A0A485L6L0_9STRA|nr:hypothetical protein As57867_016827 [Aphanomyces stellatus]VFT93648.1 Aste57867_16885 [Aphanomyces stellatus]
MGVDLKKRTPHSSLSNQARKMTGSSPPRQTTPQASLKSWTSLALKRFHRPSSAALDSHLSSSDESESHRRERCLAVGPCDPRHIVDNMKFQGGVHHTQLLLAVFNGRPLRQCCYDMAITWFRAQRGGEFELIAHADADWYQPTAQDIGASLLLQVAIDDVVVGCMEYGPVVEDPSVRTRVELLLDDKSAFFTNVRMIPSNNNPLSSEDTWALLIDDKRVRLSCESALIPPFEALYSSAVKIHLCDSRPNAFTLELEDESLYLAVDLHDRRDVIYLVFCAFSRLAMQSPALADAVSTGQSCMLTCRTVDSPATTSTMGYGLPWSTPHQRRKTTTDARYCMMPSTRRATTAAAAVEQERIDDDDDDATLVNSMLLHDVDALLLLSKEFQDQGDDDGEGRGGAAAGLSSAEDALDARVGSSVPLQSALDAMKAERQHLERQLDQLRRQRRALQ